LTTPFTIQVADKDTTRIKVTKYIDATVILHGKYKFAVLIHIFRSEIDVALGLAWSVEQNPYMEWKTGDMLISKARTNGKIVTHMIKCGSSMLSRRNEANNTIFEANNSLHHSTTD